MKRSDAMTTSAARLVHNAHVVIFDCDDTVIATAKSRWNVLMATARSFGVTLNEDTILHAWGLPFDRLIQTIVPTIDYDEFVARYRIAMRASSPEPTTGVRELLEHLAERSIRMEILTSSSRDLVTQDLDDLRLTTYFTRIYGHEETTFHKPDPRVLDVVIENLTRCGHVLSEVVYIGDSVRDFRVAAAHLVEFVAVLSGIDSTIDFTAAGLPRHRIVEDLTQLISVEQH